MRLVITEVTQLERLTHSFSRVVGSDLLLGRQHTNSDRPQQSVHCPVSTPARWLKKYVRTARQVQNDKGAYATRRATSRMATPSWRDPEQDGSEEAAQRRPFGGGVKEKGGEYGEALRGRDEARRRLIGLQRDLLAAKAQRARVGHQANQRALVREARRQHDQATGRDWVAALAKAKPATEDDLQDLAERLHAQLRAGLAESDIRLRDGELEPTADMFNKGFLDLFSEMDTVRTSACARLSVMAAKSARHDPCAMSMWPPSARSGSALRLCPPLLSLSHPTPNSLPTAPVCDAPSLRRTTRDASTSTSLHRC